MLIEIYLGCAHQFHLGSYDSLPLNDPFVIPRHSADSSADCSKHASQLSTANFSRHHSLDFSSAANLSGHPFLDSNGSQSVSSSYLDFSSADNCSGPPFLDSSGSRSISSTQCVLPNGFYPESGSQSYRDTRSVVWDSSPILEEIQSAHDEFILNTQSRYSVDGCASIPKKVDPAISPGLQNAHFRLRIWYFAPILCAIVLFILAAWLPMEVLFLLPIRSSF